MDSFGSLGYHQVFIVLFPGGHAMRSFSQFLTGLLFCICAILSSAPPAIPNVSQSIQDQYKRNYENKAMYLRIPIYSERQIVNINNGTIQPVPGLGSPIYKVGDQVRILQVNFDRDEIKFRLGSVVSDASGKQTEIVFRFGSELQESFPNRDVFEKALQFTFTEGFKSSDLDDAKADFIKEEFNRSVSRIGEAASLDRNFILGKMAPLIPDFREIERERDSLKGRVQDLSGQLAQLQSDKLKLESRVKAQQSELSLAKGTSASLQDKVNSTELQLAQLNAELLDEKKKTRNFEREMADIKRSLNMEADSNRGLTKSNAELAGRIHALQSDLEESRNEQERLKSEIDDREKEIKKLNGTIQTLTSNKNSLGRQYVRLKEEKEGLDDFVLAVDSLHARIDEEKTDGGRYSLSAGIFLGDARLGELDWNLPAFLSLNETATGEAAFKSESIDTVKMTPEMRNLLRSFGEKLTVGPDLVPLSPAMKTSPGKEPEPQALGERESYTWKWQIKNEGTDDVSFMLSAHLVDKNSRKIPLFEKEYRVESSNPVRRIRSQLKIIPVSVGVALGFLLFGIVGIFRRPRSRRTPPPPPAASGESKHYVKEKKL